MIIHEVAMSKWSKTLQENTLQHVFYGAVMKDESHNFGIFTELDGKVIIKGIKKDGGIMPIASDETIVSFDSIPEMINAGWVMD